MVAEGTGPSTYRIISGLSCSREAMVCSSSVLDRLDKSGISPVNVRGRHGKHAIPINIRDEFSLYVIAAAFAYSMIGYGPPDLALPTLLIRTLRTCRMTGGIFCESALNLTCI